MGQEIVEILAGVLAPGEVQTDRALPPRSAGPWCTSPCAQAAGRPGFFDQRQDACAGVVLVDQRLLGAEALEVLIDRVGAVGDLLDQLPLGGVGQWHAHQLLEGLDAFERQAQMVMGHGQIDLQAQVVSFPARRRRQVGHEQGAARPAAQLLQFIVGDQRRRLTGETQAHQGA
jgi:hypothetical protein